MTARVIAAVCIVAGCRGRDRETPPPPAAPDRFGLRAIGETRGDLYIQGASEARRSRDGGAHWTPVPAVPVALFDGLTWQSGESTVAFDPASGALVQKR